MVQWFNIKKDLLNPGLNYWFSSGQRLNLEPNLGSVQLGSGSNHGSELSLTITSQSLFGPRLTRNGHTQSRGSIYRHSVAIALRRILVQIFVTGVRESI